MDEFYDLNGEFIVNDRLSNVVTGKYKLYGQATSEVESEMVIAKPDEGSINSVLWVRSQKDYELPASMMIMYRDNSHQESVIEAIAGEYLEASLLIRPFNRIFGKFELLEAPRKTVVLPPIADASTRSRADLRTINYGDIKSMLTGQNDDEAFESFIDFGDLDNRIPDIKLIEYTKLRIYYMSLKEGAALELHQPNTLWREYGITYSNKPYSTELLSDKYTVNTKEKYVEFDLLDIANRWQSGSLHKYGLIIKTPEHETLSFFTRESQRSPELIVNYITTQIYSLGRSQMDGSLFINGKGYKDISGYLTVHSDVGLEYLDSFLYVHRIEHPLFEDLGANVSVSRPDTFANIIIARREKSELGGELIVANKSIHDSDSSLIINNPELYSILNIDPDAFLHSELVVARSESSETYGLLSVSYPDMVGGITISSYKRDISDLESTLVIKNTIDEYTDASLHVSTPDLWGGLSVRALGFEQLDSVFDIPYYESKDSDISINNPDLPSTMLIKYIDQIGAALDVKEKDFLDSLIDVKQISELSGSLIVRQINEQETDIVINTPDLYSVIHPRVIGQNDLDILASIRKRDVSDLDSYILIRGKSNGSYWFIY